MRGSGKGGRRARYIIAERRMGFWELGPSFICGSVCSKVNDKLHKRASTGRQRVESGTTTAVRDHINSRTNRLPTRLQRRSWINFIHVCSCNVPGHTRKRGLQKVTAVCTRILWNVLCMRLSIPISGYVRDLSRSKRAQVLSNSRRWASCRQTTHSSLSRRTHDAIHVLVYHSEQVLLNPSCTGD